ncbi:MAG: exodeoxyribonuclease VII large subunit [Acidobacteriota bacterium]
MNLLPFMNQRVFTVSELTSEIKDRLESEFTDILVEGEISNFTAASSGHLYFVLKDKRAQLRSVCFRTRARLLRFRPEDGMQVIARGNLGVYEVRGEYQLYVDHLEPKGLGSLQMAFEQLKARLQTEGLFDPAHKKPLPLLPRSIGIVTSPSGAALQDILRILRRRHESVRVLIYPAKVQGEGAAEEIAAGIRFLNTVPDVDVLIVGRGGGSIEDLWAFNEESVARSIHASTIPVISAVGHEVDFTIADFVADLRAPTPSAAAELVVTRKAELSDQIANLDRRLHQKIAHQIDQTWKRVLELSSHRAFTSLEHALRSYRQRLDESILRLQTSQQAHVRALTSRWQLQANTLDRFDLVRFLNARRDLLQSLADQADRGMRLRIRNGYSSLNALERELNALNPLAVLDRGYAICRDERGVILRDASRVQPGDAITVTLAKGTIDGRAERTRP